MKIQLAEHHKSIQGIETSELPDFAVLIGRNGAGKTQLLTALKEGHAQVPGVSRHAIELFNMHTFQVPDSRVGTRTSNDFAKNTADAFLIGTPSGPSPAQNAEEIFDQVAAEVAETSGDEARDEFVANLRERVRQLPDFTLYPGPLSDGNSYDQLLGSRVLSPLIPPVDDATRRRQRQQQNQPTSCYQNPAILISLAMKLTGKLTVTTRPPAPDWAVFALPGTRSCRRRCR